VLLTDDEKRMRDGDEGEAVAAAMDLLIRYGDALEAERLVDTRNVAGTMTQPSPAKAALVAEGGWAHAFAVMNLDHDGPLDIPDVRVPTCQLQHGFAADAEGLTAYPAASIRLQEDAEAYFTARGVRVLGTCTPYQVGNLPARDEHCAWMESSAVVYANSVLGARTNCEGASSTGAASLTGKIPYWGNHIPENRYATHLVRADVDVTGFQEWGMLGYHVGDRVLEARPAVVGRLAPPSDADLKHFGAATATSGGVELYHLPGITPEAPTLEAAFGGGDVPRSAETIVYGRRERAAVYEALNGRGESDEVDFVLLGCPHASLEQVAEIAGMLEGRRLHDGAQLWVMLPRALAEQSLRAGWTRTITRAGGRVLMDSCPAMSRAAPPGTRVMATDSAKQAHYLPAILGIEAWFGTTRECVDAAVTGRWRGELA
jgi:predicted aconitase